MGPLKLLNDDLDIFNVEHGFNPFHHGMQQLTKYKKLPHMNYLSGSPRSPWSKLVPLPRRKRATIHFTHTLPKPEPLRTDKCHLWWQHHRRELDSSQAAKGSMLPGDIGSPVQGHMAAGRAGAHLGFTGELAAWVPLDLQIPL